MSSSLVRRNGEAVRRFFSGIVSAFLVSTILDLVCVVARSSPLPDDVPPIDPGPSSGSAIEAFEPKVLSLMPVPTVQVRPIYPLDLRKAHLSGEVVVDFIVTTHGNVVRAFAIGAANKEFADAAVSAVSKWKFKPGKIGSPCWSIPHMQVPIAYLSYGRSARQISKFRDRFCTWRYSGAEFFRRKRRSSSDSALSGETDLSG